MTKADLIARVSAYFARQFNGDYGAAFRNYATDGGDRVGLAGLVKLLDDAGVNSDWTREIWARAIMRALDTNADGRISEAEFRHAVGWEGCENE